MIGFAVNFHYDARLLALTQGLVKGKLTMPVPSRNKRTLATGPFGTVEYAVRSNGQLEAMDWLESQPDNLQASFGVLFERIVTEGRIHNKQQFRQLRDQVWEFKRAGNRILCFQNGRRRLLTHRIKKGGSKKCPPKEISRANRIANEHIEWEAQQGKK